MPAMPLCAKAREEAPARTQTTVNAIIEREVVIPKVLRRRGQLMEQAGGESRKGEARAITNEYVASLRVVDTHLQGAAATARQINVLESDTRF